MTTTRTNKPSDVIHAMLSACQNSNADWALRHNSAWMRSDFASDPIGRREIAIRKMIVSWTQFGETHAEMCGSPIGDDGLLGEAFESMGHALRQMLNGECGRFDCGTLDQLIMDIARACNVELDENRVKGELLAPLQP